MPVKKVARPDLPEEILFDIFSRLPAKSVGKFRTLSKTWRNLLSTPQFIKSHLALQNTRQQSLILIPRSRGCVIRCVETIRGEYDDTVLRQLKLPGVWTEFLGSLDGLVLLKNSNAEVFLVNPITLEQSKIPNPPVSTRIYTSFYRFGYNSVGDDYNVVAVYYQFPDNNIFNCDRVYYNNTLVYVYYVKRGVWKKIESSLRHCSKPVDDSGTYFNGAIHWLVRKSTDCVVIAAFDLDSELFFEIPAPSVANVNNLFFGSPSVRGGCLCVVTESNIKGVDVWIMKNYGAPESWTKITFSGCCGDFCHPFYFIGGGKDEVLLFITYMRLVVYNVKEGATIVDRVPGKFANGGTFVGSLVSPLNP